MIRHSIVWLFALVAGHDMEVCAGDAEDGVCLLQLRGAAGREDAEDEGSPASRRMDMAAEGDEDEDKPAKRKGGKRKGGKRKGGKNRNAAGDDSDEPADTEGDDAEDEDKPAKRKGGKRKGGKRKGGKKGGDDSD